MHQRVHARLRRAMGLYITLHSGQTPEIGRLHLGCSGNPADRSNDRRPSMSDNPHTPLSGTVLPPSRGRRTGWIVAAVIAAGLTGAAASSALSHGLGFGPGGWHG